MNAENIRHALGACARHPGRVLRRCMGEARRALRRAALRNRDFTVLSNNCFGGFVYQHYGLPYRTPTAGLFFMPEDYLRLLRDPRRYFAAPLTFIDPASSRHAAALAASPRYGGYPVARLLDVEIFFMHYSSEQEAREKWTRRAARINWDNLLVKFCDQNGATEAQLRAFDALPYAHKVCFTARAYPGLACGVVLRRDAGEPCVRAETEELYFTRDYPLTRRLNAMRRRVK